MKVNCVRRPLSAESREMPRGMYSIPWIIVYGLAYWMGINVHGDLI